MDNADQDRLRAGHFLPFIVPGGGWCSHLFTDACAHGRVFQTLQELCIAAVVRPRRDKCGKGIEPCRVGIGVCTDVEACLPGFFDLGNNAGHAPPVRLTRRLQMPDLHRYFGFTSDADSFIEGGRDCTAFASDMGSVNASEPGALSRQRDQFLRTRVRRGSVLERGGNTHRAILHCLAHERFHLFQFGLVRRPVVIAQYDSTHLGSSDIAPKVDPNPLLFESGEVLLKGSPIRGDVQMLIVDPVRLDDCFVERGDRPAFAGQLSGNTLKYFRGKMGVDQN